MWGFTVRRQFNEIMLTGTENLLNIKSLEIPHWDFRSRSDFECILDLPKSLEKLCFACPSVFILPDAQIKFAEIFKGDKWVKTNFF